MNFSQLHERLRVEILRRIERGSLTAASLARQTGLQQPHISNFLHSKRRLSLPALDRVLAALALSIDDLLATQTPPGAAAAALDAIPLVSQTSAMHDATFTGAGVTEHIQLPAGSLDDPSPRSIPRRKDWQRFCAVGITPAQARPMEPVLTPNNVVVLDRHYTSLANYRPAQPNIYAVQLDGNLLFRYVSFELNRLILRPHGLSFPIQLVEIEPLRSPRDLIIGRVCAAIVRL